MLRKAFSIPRPESPDILNKKILKASFYIYFQLTDFKPFLCFIVYCGFILKINVIKVWSKSCSVVSDSLQPMDYMVHGILQARILQWVLFLLQGIFPTQGLNQVSRIAGRFFISWATREHFTNAKVLILKCIIHEFDW